MTEELVERVAKAALTSIEQGSAVIYHGPRNGDPHMEIGIDGDVILADLARAIIPIVLEEATKHLAAAQYERAPYTAMKYRLAKLQESIRSLSSPILTEEG